MRNPFNSLILVLAVCLLAVPTAPSQAQESQVSPRMTLRAMSFNIRLGVANDGANHWDKRKPIVVETIRKFGPDFVGTQETWDFQAEYLDQQLPNYTYVGRSRQSDGKGEHCGILYRTDRFDRLIEGHFWLSETPDRPGSKSWDSSLPRMATWLKLWDRNNERSLYVINTHFDHRGNLARSESAKLIREFIDKLPIGSDVVVTGDFNAPVGSAPYNSLFARNNAGDSPVVDTFLSVNTASETPDENGPPGADNALQGTFNGFEGVETGARIDWIAVSRNLDIVTAAIDRSSFDGRFPSDHFPVTAELQFQNSP